MLPLRALAGVLCAYVGVPVGPRGRYQNDPAEQTCLALDLTHHNADRAPVRTEHSRAA